MENAWEQEAYTVSTSYGLPINWQTGMPDADLAPSADGGKAVQAETAYVKYCQQAQQNATALRVSAAGALAGIFTAEAPNFDYGQLSNDLDSLRALWGSPTAYRQSVEDEVAELLKQHSQLKTFFNMSVRGLPPEVQAELDSIYGKAQEAATKLVDAMHLENVSHMLASGDTEGLSRLAGWDSFIESGGKALKAVPYLGATAGLGITIWGDLKMGKNPGIAVGDGAANTAAAFYTGGVVTDTLAGLGEGLGAGAITGSMVTGGAILVGGVAAVGVGDFVHNLFVENWSGDIHTYGVLGGVGHGVADSFDTTRHDMAHYGDDILHVFGL